MKIRTKLRLGFGFLFGVVIFFGALSLFYINEIAKSSKIILKDNYQSLRYVREMRKVLDENTIPLQPGNINIFKNYLNKEKENITEPGEQRAALALEKAFNAFISQAPLVNSQEAFKDIKTALLNVEVVNMNAIVKKNDAAQASVQEKSLMLGLAGTFAFLVLFSFSVNFPNFILEPLRKLQEGIAEITRQNYSARLHLPQNDEFATLAHSFNSMATRLKEWENSNLASVLSDKRRIEAIIEQMTDAIIGIDEKREILFINTSAKELLSLADAKPEGRGIDDLSKGNDLMKTIIAENPGGKPFKIVVNGKESHYRLETRQISVPNMNTERSDRPATASKPAGEVYILENITEFKELDLAKTNFIATISHELKTPISSIKMSLKLLNDERVGYLNPEQQQLISHIAEDSARLLKITSELLELSQVETGNIQLSFVAAEPLQIVNYAVDAVKFQAEQKHVDLEIISAGNMPKVQVDVEKTAWVLVNFLSNALRYSPERSKVIIELKNDTGRVEFSVKDFGKGIDGQFQKRLFDRYFQVPADGQNKSGSGLGLAISKDFIEVQQGKIGLQSALGEGSRFYFTLPAL